MLSGYFVYLGNRNTRKAGSYVKELCHALFFMHEKQSEDQIPVTIFNMSMDPGPSIEEYVDTVCEVAGKKTWILDFPYSIVLLASRFINFFAGAAGIKNNPIHPLRIKKLGRSNNVRPTVLLDSGYIYHYDLRGAFDDWRKDMPAEW